MSGGNGGRALLPYSGGQGWGNGGNVTYQAMATAGNHAYGGSGGAGSALVIGGVAAVVAGAGAGSGHRRGPHVASTHGVFTPIGDLTGAGGDAAFTVAGAAANSTDARLRRTLLTDSTVITHAVTAIGGRGASAVGGAGGSPNVVTGSFSTTANIAGLAGGTGSTTAGGNGANGRNTSFSSPTWNAIPATSGGGGGGYSGGGSGGIAAGQFSEASMVVAAGGGGGSNYVASTAGGVAVSNTSVGPASERLLAEVPGEVTVQFQAPPGLDLSTCGVVV